LLILFLSWLPLYCFFNLIILIYMSAYRKSSNWCCRKYRWCWSGSLDCKTWLFPFLFFLLTYFVAIFMYSFIFFDTGTSTCCYRAIFDHISSFDSRRVC
jgi:hypothetical protein